MRTPRDWGQPCPHPACAHYNRTTCGNVSALAPSLPHSGTRRLLRCQTCETQCSATRATVFCDLCTAEDNGMMALTMLLVRVDLAGSCCMRGMAAETGLSWRRRAAHQATVIYRHRLRALPVTQGQRDEVWNCLERQHTGETEATAASGPAGADGRQWGWSSFAPRVGG